MIPFLLLLILKNYHREKSAAVLPPKKEADKKPVLIKSAHSLLFIMMLSISLCAQERILRYSVLHNGDIKGKVLVYQTCQGHDVHIKIESEVSIRLLWRISVISLEEAIFRDGILVYSSLCRKINGDEKINQQLKAAGTSYVIIQNKEATSQTIFPIRYSILSLYYLEPIHIDQVYSDNYRQYVGIKKVDSNKYKIEFPNGNYNYYSYKNGLCVKVEVNQPFYDLQFKLIQ
jgi:hypothetical protein